MAGGHLARQECFGLVPRLYAIDYGDSAPHRFQLILSNLLITALAVQEDRGGRRDDRRHCLLRVLGLRGRDRALADHDPRDAWRDPDRPPGAVAAQPRAVGADRAGARARDAPRPELSDVLCGGGGADRRGGMAAPAPRRRGAADGLRLARAAMAL